MSWERSSRDLTAYIIGFKLSLSNPLSPGLHRELAAPAAHQHRPRAAFSVFTSKMIGDNYTPQTTQQPAQADVTHYPRYNLHLGFVPSNNNGQQEFNLWFSLYLEVAPLLSSHPSAGP